MQHETMLMLILIRVLIVLHVMTMAMTMGPLDRRQIKNPSPLSRRTMYDVRCTHANIRVFWICLRSVFGIRYNWYNVKYYMRIVHTRYAPREGSFLSLL